MKLAIAQCNPTVGDLAGNAQLILEWLRKAEGMGADLVVFPELAVTGYPPEDLLLKPAFIKENIALVKSLASQVGKTAVLVGFVNEQKGNRFNAAAWLENKKIRAVYHKKCLPNYGVFDEQRYFNPGDKSVAVSFRGQKVGLTICEDIWLGPEPLVALKKQKPNLVINISASPFHVDKLSTRHKVAGESARFLKAPLVYCNQIGGQDELVFDGGSFVVDAKGHLVAQYPQFAEGLFTSSEKVKPIASIDQIHEALLLGIRDYVQKNHFKKVTVGLSGGIDSALVATLAVQALGPERVAAVTMPSRFSSKETHSDAVLLAKNLGIELLDIPIQAAQETFLKILEPKFNGTEPNIAEENLQARIRGTLLMALSNKFGWLVLTTGNKSEISTGYCTLYGDTAGGFAVLKDVLKTTVYALSKRINEKAGRELIPESTITRRPTAELRADQFDEDSLGAYADLDPVIIDYVEKNKAPQGDYAKKIISLIDRAEYKRRQAPPGIKITPRSFGRDHRMPITNRYSNR